MSFIRDAIQVASRSSGCEVIELSREESAVVRSCVEEKYAATKGLLPLWERLKDDKSKYDPDGWKLIGEFPFKGMVTIFFDRESETTMYTVNSCGDVVKLISECPGFVFYIANKDCSFLLCHNDHDYLIGAGIAKDWVGGR